MPDDLILRCTRLCLDTWGCSDMLLPSTELVAWWARQMREHRGHTILNHPLGLSLSLLSLYDLKLCNILAAIENLTTE